MKTEKIKERKASNLASGEPGKKHAIKEEREDRKENN